MLTRREMLDKGPQSNANWPVAAVLSALVCVALFGLLNQWGGLSATPAAFPEGTDTLALLGNALVSPDAYVLPFEVASVLLLAALIGAVYVSRNQK